MKQKIINNLDEIFILFGFISFTFFAIGLKDMDNYANWLAFSITLIIAGILLGIIIYFILRKFFPGISSYKNSNGISVLTLLVISFSFISFGAGVIINEYPSTDIECHKYTIQDMGESGGTHSSYHIFINTGTKTERLDFGKEFYDKHNRGDIVELCIITGKLGFNYYKIKPTQ